MDPANQWFEEIARAEAAQSGKKLIFPRLANSRTIPFCKLHGN